MGRDRKYFLAIWQAWQLVRPVDGRPVDGRPVDGRPVDDRPADRTYGDLARTEKYGNVSKSMQGTCPSPCRERVQVHARSRIKA